MSRQEGGATGARGTHALQGTLCAVQQSGLASFGAQTVCAVVSTLLIHSWPMYKLEKKTMNKRLALILHRAQPPSILYVEVPLYWHFHIATVFEFSH